MSKKILQNAKPIEDKVINGIIYKMRTDVGTFCKDRFEANILRIILLLKGTFTRLYLNNLDIIVDEQGKLFNHEMAYILVNLNLTDKLLNDIQQFEHDHSKKLYLITSEKMNYKVKTYEQFEQEFKQYLPLWETSRQNVDKTPDLYKRQWVIGKRELKRQHKKFFQPEGKSVKIGQLWKKQPFKGRPYYNQMFMDTFKVYDSKTNKVIFKHDNWGSIIMAVRRYMKDNVYQYYNTNRFAICAGHVKKTNEWIDIVRYDAMATLYLNDFK